VRRDAVQRGPSQPPHRREECLAAAASFACVIAGQSDSFGQTATAKQRQIAAILSGKRQFNAKTPYLAQDSQQGRPLFTAETAKILRCSRQELDSIGPVVNLHGVARPPAVSAGIPPEGEKPCVDALFLLRPGSA
jgi:outer membrane murein-binding lipoprotein Lpp